MKTTQEIHEMIKDCAKAIGEVTDGSYDTYKGWIEALNWVTMANEQPTTNIKEINGRWTCTDCGYEWSAMLGDNEIPVKCDCDKLPDGLQKYIDGVALNTLYRNYHKSTN